MEENTNEKSVKVVAKASKSSAIRVRKETRRRLLQDLAKINKKDYGRKVKADELVTLALNKVTASDLKTLQEGSLSNSDRLEQQFKEYAAKHGAISKDEFLGKMMAGELHTLASKNNSEKSGYQPD